MIYLQNLKMNSKFKINFNDLTFARLYYFAFMGGWGFILPFINLFYVSLGLNGTQIGFISSTSAIRLRLQGSPHWLIQWLSQLHRNQAMDTEVCALGVHWAGSSAFFHRESWSRNLGLSPASAEFA